MDVQGLGHIPALGGWGFGGAENSWGGFLAGIKKPAWAGLGGVGVLSALVCWVAACWLAIDHHGFEVWWWRGIAGHGGPGCCGCIGLGARWELRK